MIEYSNEPLWLWILFNAVVIGLIILDLAVHKKRVSASAALAASCFWVGIALLFNLFIWQYRGSEVALNFFTGYLIEKALSVDNLFVFLLIFEYFQTPKELQHKVLFWGILGAIAMRALFIYAGISLVFAFHWIFYLLGAFLIVASFKMIMPTRKPNTLDENFILRSFKWIMPISPSYSGDRFFAKDAGRWQATPLFATLLIIEVTDVIFALDSIPAVMGITLDPFIVYSSNILAVIGLRSLYFVLAALLPLFRYLKYALAVILVFIGFKMVAAPWIEIPVGIALGVVVVCLMIGALAGLWQDGKDKNDSL